MKNFQYKQRIGTEKEKVADMKRHLEKTFKHLTFKQTCYIYHFIMDSFILGVILVNLHETAIQK